MRLDEYGGRLAQATLRTWRENRERAARSSQLLFVRDPRHAIRFLREDIDQLTKGLRGGMTAILDSKQKGWEKEGARLDALSPLAILRRGYSITRRLPDGLILRAADQVEGHGQVSVRLHRGELICRVERKV